MLFSLATVARASSEGPDASPRVEAKVREIEILLDHCEQASRARERDADAEEGGARPRSRDGQGQGGGRG
jgi:hypothetical protein